MERETRVEIAPWASARFAAAAARTDADDEDILIAPVQMPGAARPAPRPPIARAPGPRAPATRPPAKAGRR
jgi:ATP-dependent RNA helicase DeaD